MNEAVAAPPRKTPTDQPEREQAGCSADQDAHDQTDAAARTAGGAFGQGSGARRAIEDMYVGIADLGTRIVPLGFPPEHT